MRAFLLALLLVAAPAVAKEVALFQLLGQGVAKYVGNIDIPFENDLAEFEDMTDCKLYMYWDHETRTPYTFQDGQMIPHTAFLTCVGTEGAIHETFVDFVR